MNGPTWEQIIDAVIAGDARIGPYIAREIVKADNRAQSVFPEAISPTMPPAPLSALETPVDVETLADRAGLSGDGNGVDVAIDTADYPDAGNDGNSSVETAADNTVIALPEASRVEGGNDIFPRPKSRKGFSKELRRVWDWLDAHANEITHDLPVQRDVAEATDVSHPTAGKALKRWRDHNGVTKPDYYRQEAS